jgi:beta-lactamase superfamily II metal-dependent hydrolase
MERLINVDLADVWSEDDRYVMTLAWGDRVEVTGETADHVEIVRTTFRAEADLSRRPRRVRGRIKKRRGRRLLATAAELSILRADFVDVQQGDGAVLETPGGSVVLIDGGDNKLFARYLAGRFRGTSDAEPKEIDAIVVTHGDADHFSGLSEIADSEGLTDRPHKQLFLHPRRVFHNGLVKRPSSRKETELLGPTVRGPDGPVIVGLVDELRDVPDSEMNRDFKRWKQALLHWARRGPIEIRRLQRGDDQAFDFLAGESVAVQVLGPLTEQIRGQTGLRFLGEPLRRFGHRPSGRRRFGAPSASHTINGHSIVLRVTFGSWNLLFAGDLNEQAEETLAADHDARAIDLRSEVLKVPHHGSADYLPDFLRAVAPIVSVVSSGDESARKEYIHPRATLMAGLGRYARIEEPVVFVTELVAFFAARGWAQLTDDQDADERVRRGPPFYAFSREAWGTVRVRTDGERLLVFTDSGLPKMKEAYVFRLGDGGAAEPQEPVRA